MAEEPIEEVVAALREDGLYVAPSASSLVTEQQQAEIAENLAALDAADAPVYVVVEKLQDTGRFGGKMDQMLTLAHDAGEGELDGVYIGTDFFYSADFAEDRDIAPYTLTTREWSPSAELPTTFDAYDVDLVEKDLGAGLVTLTDALASYVDGDTGEWDSYITEIREAREDSLAATSGGDGDGFPIVAVGVVVAIAVVVTVLVRRSSRRTKEGTAVQPSRGGRQRVFTLPPSALDLVRAAHDARIVGRGRDELLALGESIDEAELTDRGDAGAWQAALDHYDAARRVLRPEEPADDVPLLDGVGGLVLAERGRAALAAALRGRSYRPQAPCFLNPLHGTGGNAQDVEVAGERLHAPLCTRCRRDLKRGSRPEILDVMVDGQPRHYFDTEAQPWAATGYGALQPDLVSALHRARR